MQGWGQAGIELEGARDTDEENTEVEEDRPEEKRGGNKTEVRKIQGLGQHQRIQNRTLK